MGDSMRCLFGCFMPEVTGAVIPSLPCQAPRSTQKRGTMRRYQKPSPKRVKIGRQWVWKVQYRDLQMVPRTKVLGHCEEMTRAQAELAAAEILRPINAEAGREKPAPVSFGAFVREVFLPVSRGRWKRSTAMTTEPRINLHLVRPLDERPIGNITRQELQGLLEEKAQKLSFSVFITCAGT